MVLSLASLLSTSSLGSALPGPMIGLKAQKAPPAFTDKLGSIIWRFLQKRCTHSEVVMLSTAAGRFVMSPLLLAFHAVGADLGCRRHGD